MGGEHGPDRDSGQDVGDRRRRDAALGQCLDRREGRFQVRVSGCGCGVTVHDQLPHECLILCQVDESEPRGEGAHDHQCVVHGSGAQQLSQLRSGVGVATPMGDRQSPDALDEGEPVLAFDVGDGPAEQIAQEPHLCAGGVAIHVGCPSSSEHPRLLGLRLWSWSGGLRCRAC
jgi:hypothetical protein